MAGLSLCLGLLVAGLGWVLLRQDTYVAPAPSVPQAAIQPGQAAESLHRLERAVREGDAAAAGAVAADAGSQRLLRAIVRNADAIGVEDFALRYVDPVGGIDAQGRWTATVETRWRFAGFDREQAVADVEVALVAQDDRTAIEAIGGPGGRSPIWLSGPVEVEHDDQTLVVAATGAGRYARLARRAVPVVRRVLPDWRDGLVVEVPGSAPALDAALGAEEGQYAAVAAVTSGVGDQLGDRSPVHVFVNPSVFGGLERQGAQVVMSHEAVHVATRAAAEPGTVPSWLTEGFADYVALRDVDLPLSVTAAQVIRSVRSDGPPRTLPGERDFDTRTAHLGASYEAAWLACRLLADRAGEAALTGFYTGLEEGDDVGREFRAAFGLSLPAFTRQWRASLSDLAA